LNPQEVLAQVLDAGGRVISDLERPRLLAPPNLRPLVEKHREALRLLILVQLGAQGVRPAPQAAEARVTRVDPEIKRRARIFHAQISEPGPALFMHLPVIEGRVPREGECLSCAGPLPGGSRWRCPLCLAAARLALD
jgi:hypothetical protein